MMVDAFGLSLTAVKVGCTAISLLFGYRFRKEIRRTVRDMFTKTDDIEKISTEIRNDIDLTIEELINHV